MMILVGVTVSVVMQGGLFDKATIASIKHETATMQEYIVTAGADLLADKAKNGDPLNVTVYEILEKKYSITQPTPIQFESVPNYISNADAQINTAETYYLIKPIQLKVNSTRGNGAIAQDGTVKDVFVVDSNKRVYYIKAGKTLEPIGELTEIQKIQAGYNGFLANTETDDFKTLEQYFGLANEGSGVNITTLMDQNKSTDESIVLTNGITFAPQSDMQISEDQTEIYISIQYNNVPYTLTMGSSDSVTKKLESKSLTVADADVLADQKDIWKIKFSETGNKYTLDIDGNITGPINLNEIEEYILGEYGTGRSLMDLVDFESRLFKDDPATPDIDETTTLAMQFLDQNIPTKQNKSVVDFYAKSGNDVYRLSTDFTYVTKEIENVYTPTGKEGQDLGEVLGDEKYAGWIILYDNGESVDAISPYLSDQRLTLGAYNNSNAVGDTDVEKAINSYNSAITDINEYIKKDTTTFEGNAITYYTSDGTTNGVRSVGAGVDPRNLETEGDYYNLSEIGSVHSGKIKKEDNSYEQDLVRMLYYNCWSVDYELYWVASREIRETEEGIEAGLFVPYHDDAGFNPLFGENMTYGTQKRHYVRPIITIPTN